MNVLYPKDAGSVLILPVARRCTNCGSYSTCEKLKGMKKNSKYNSLVYMLHETPCKEFFVESPTIINDETDVRRLVSMVP